MVWTLENPPMYIRASCQMDLCKYVYKSIIGPAIKSTVYGSILRPYTKINCEYTYI